MIFDIRRLFAAFARRRPPHARDPFARGVAALALGEHARAIAEFEDALPGAPGDRARATLHNKRGVAYVGLGDPAAALEAFAMALDYDERCAPALANVGNLLFEEGHPADALGYYEAATRADPEYPIGFRNLGVVLKALGRRSEAVRALRTASRLESRRRSERA